MEEEEELGIGEEEEGEGGFCRESDKERGGGRGLDE